MHIIEIIVNLAKNQSNYEKPKTYRKNQQCSSRFEQETTMQTLSALGKPLKSIKDIVDFEMSRGTLFQVIVVNVEKYDSEGNAIVFSQTCNGITIQQKRIISYYK